MIESKLEDISTQIEDVGWELCKLLEEQNKLLLRLATALEGILNSRQ